ncbi:MAG: phosphatidate cytidylyltransferase [Kiritimatiellae bacterium]|nr:phosphatidate cytidylyltransferase [Kiritimatiellia bacterium]
MSKLPSIKNRLASGISIAVALFAAFFFLPDAFLPLILAAIAALLSLEFYQILTAAGIPNFNRWGTVASVLLTLAAWYRPPDLRIPVLLVCVVAILLRQFPQKNNPRPIETIAGTLLGIFYIGFLWSMMATLVTYNSVMFTGSVFYIDVLSRDLVTVSMGTRWILLYAVFAAKFTDIGAYLVGCLFGRHKLFPRISPNKSWEGVFGGLFLGTLSCTLLARFIPETFHSFTNIELPLPFIIIASLFVCIAGIVGDLVESLFKRAAAIKDSAGFIPGMGGTLDLLDSILFTAPATYLVLRLVA